MGPGRVGCFFFGNNSIVHPGVRVAIIVGTQVRSLFEMLDIIYTLSDKSDVPVLTTASRHEGKFPMGAEAYLEKGCIEPLSHPIYFAGTWGRPGKTVLQLGVTYHQVEIA